jgi:hypothetical protein
VTAEELVTGLRERGYSVLRMQVPPETIIPRVDRDDPLYPWLKDDLGVAMIEYRYSTEVPFTYEARLHRARVEVPEELQPDNPAALVAVRARLIWEAAA